MQNKKEVYIKALEKVIERKTASISMLQRTIGIGYPKASKIMNWLEENGYILRDLQTQTITVKATYEDLVALEEEIDAVEKESLNNEFLHSEKKELLNETKFEKNKSKNKEKMQNNNKNCEKLKKQSNGYDLTYKMLCYYQDEYFRRHNHFWSTLKMFFVLNIAVSLLPFVSGIIGIEIKSSVLPIFIFPIVGVMIAIISYVILIAEAKTFSRISNKKKQISQSLPKEFAYEVTANKKKVSLSVKLSHINFVFQILVAILSLVLTILN